MRLLVVAISAVVVLALGAYVLGVTVLRPEAAATRLSGVSVAISGFAVEDLSPERHRLSVTVSVASDRDVDECLAFTLDEPFAARRLTALPDTCVRPRAGRESISLVFDRLTDDDLLFTAHTLVWGVPGGRCGFVFELVGLCVVDQAGTASIELPSRVALPTLGPFGSIGPIFSFPAFSFPAP